jgi:hypothetical protein
MLAARSKAVSTPSLWAFRSIWAVASQMVTSLGSIILTVSAFLLSIVFSLHEIIEFGALGKEFEEKLIRTIII